MKKRRRRSAPEINAGSMADIAFLLLIFFLVATTIMQDKGIKVELPPWSDDEPIAEIAARNLLLVDINFEGQLLVEEKELDISELKELTKEFVLNPLGKKEFASSPGKAIISLRNDRNTDYETYIAVYNELKAAYNELWNQKATREYGNKYSKLSKGEQYDIRQAIPQVISESEPTDFAQE